MDDEEGAVDLGKMFVIGEAVAWEKRNVGDCAEGAEKGGDEDDSSDFFLCGEPRGRSGANRVADEDDVLRVNLERFCKVLVSSGDGAVTSFFTGLTVTFSVAGIVIGDDAEALLV